MDADKRSFKGSPRKRLTLWELRHSTDFECGLAWRSDRRSVKSRYRVRRIRIDNSILDRQNAIMFCRTSAVEILFLRLGLSFSCRPIQNFSPSSVFTGRDKQW